MSKTDTTPTTRRYCFCAACGIEQAHDDPPRECPECGSSEQWHTAGIVL